VNKFAIVALEAALLTAISTVCYFGLLWLFDRVAAYLRRSRHIQNSTTATAPTSWREFRGSRPPLRQPASLASSIMDTGYALPSGSSLASAIEVNVANLAGNSPLMGRSEADFASKSGVAPMMEFA
jgi:hypothetical protein